MIIRKNIIIYDRIISNNRIVYRMFGNVSLVYN